MEKYIIAQGQKLYPGASISLSGYPDQLFGINLGNFTITPGTSQYGWYARSNKGVVLACSYALLNSCTIVATGDPDTPGASSLPSAVEVSNKLDSMSATLDHAILDDNA